MPENDNPYDSRSALNNQIPFFDVTTNFLKNSFFAAVITKWNNLDISIRNSSPFHIFKNLILKLIRPEPNRISSTQNFEGLKLVTRMRLALSHSANHKIRHNFKDCFFTVSIAVVQDKHFLKKLTSLILIFLIKTTYL